MLPPGTSAVVWQDAAQLPWRPFLPDMQDRGVIDAAFADHAVSNDPAGRNRFRCFAVRTGGNRQLGSSIVPHTWLWSVPARQAKQVVNHAGQVVIRVLKAQIALATNRPGPGSPVA